MKRFVGTGLLVAMTLGLSIGVASAQTVDQRRQLRAERMQQLRQDLREMAAKRREAQGQRTTDQRMIDRRAQRLEQLRQQRERVRQRYMERVDRNRDGQITRAERQRARAELRQTFRRFWRR